MQRQTRCSTKLSHARSFFLGAFFPFSSGEKLKVVHAEKAPIVNDEGAEVDSVDVIRDNDKLFVVTEEDLRRLAAMEPVPASS